VGGGGGGWPSIPCDKKLLKTFDHPLFFKDIPAIYLTARVAVYCVIALYIAVIFSFPAYLYLDMRRQAAGKRDVFFFADAPAHQVEEVTKSKPRDFRAVLFYDRFFEPLVLGNNVCFRQLVHLVIWLIAMALLAGGIYGTTERHIGLGLEDFFPSKNQASVWAQQRTKSLASWSAAINWGALEVRCLLGRLTKKKLTSFFLFFYSTPIPMYK
jgi:hypothetical protein